MLRGNEMKVLKQADTSAWRYKFTCSKCDSELEAEGSDLKHKHVDGGDMRDPYPSYDLYTVNCAVCQESRNVPEKDIPKALIHQVKERCKLRSSSYFDR